MHVSQCTRTQSGTSGAVDLLLRLGAVAHREAVVTHQDLAHHPQQIARIPPRHENQIGQLLLRIAEDPPHVDPSRADRQRVGQVSDRQRTSCDSEVPASRAIAAVELRS